MARNQLTEEEYEVFSSYYCGLCRSIGKRASQAARIGLSYDITFLALVLSSVCSDDVRLNEGRCIAHPKRKRSFVADDMSCEYAAEMGVVLEYLKLVDDWRDERSIKALFGRVLLYCGYAAVRRRRTETVGFIKGQLDILSALEKANCRNIDETADAFAKILEKLFVPDYIEDEKWKRILSWFGYNLGRWIYIMDAFNDLEADMKSGVYNPLICAGYTAAADCAEAIEPSLTMTLGNIASAFELMEFKNNKTIIGKMVYISLKEKQKSVLSGEWTKRGRVNA